MGTQQSTKIQGVGTRKRTNQKSDKILAKGQNPLAEISQTASEPQAARPDAILTMQQTLGNQAVQRLIAGRKPGQAIQENQPLPARVNRKIQSARGGGQNLPENLRTEMEEQLGHTLGDVHLHQDSEADTLSRTLNAQAFTTGNDIFFSRKVGNPHSAKGRKTLLHELTHTLQQFRTSTSGTLKLGPVNDILENQADRMAGKGRSAAAKSGTMPAAGGVVQRVKKPEDEFQEVSPEEDPLRQPEKNTEKQGSRIEMLKKQLQEKANSPSKESQKLRQETMSEMQGQVGEGLKKREEMEKKGTPKLHSVERQEKEVQEREEEGRVMIGQHHKRIEEESNQRTPKLHSVQLQEQLVKEREGEMFQGIQQGKVEKEKEKIEKSPEVKPDVPKTDVEKPPELKPENKKTEDVTPTVNKPHPKKSGLEFTNVPLGEDPLSQPAKDPKEEPKTTDVNKKRQFDKIGGDDLTKLQGQISKHERRKEKLSEDDIQKLRQQIKESENKPTLKRTTGSRNLTKDLEDEKPVPKKGFKEKAKDFFTGIGTKIKEKTHGPIDKLKGKLGMETDDDKARLKQYKEDFPFADMQTEGEEPEQSTGQKIKGAIKGIPGKAKSFLKETWSGPEKKPAFTPQKFRTRAVKGKSDPDRRRARRQRAQGMYTAKREADKEKFEAFEKEKATSGVMGKIKTKAKALGSKALTKVKAKGTELYEKAKPKVAELGGKIKTGATNLYEKVKAKLSKKKDDTGPKKSWKEKLSDKWSGFKGLFKRGGKTKDPQDIEMEEFNKPSLKRTTGSRNLKPDGQDENRSLKRSKGSRDLFKDEQIQKQLKRPLPKPPPTKRKEEEKVENVDTSLGLEELFKEKEV